MSTRGDPRIRLVHPLQWVLEPLLSREDFLQRKMFGCEAAYLGGRLVMMLASGKEPWNGLLICTSRESHAALLELIPQARPHKVLGKWLYVSQRADAFEAAAAEVARLVAMGDVRIGVEPRPRARRKRMTREKR